MRHLQASTVHILKFKGIIQISSSNDSHRVCESYPLGKLSKLSFLPSFNLSQDIFDKIHCDLCGLAPIISVGKFQYYAYFVNAFFKYTWFIWLHKKFNFFSIFLIFEKYVERKFNKKLKFLKPMGVVNFLTFILPPIYNKKTLLFTSFHALTPLNRMAL